MIYFANYNNCSHSFFGWQRFVSGSIRKSGISIRMAWTSGIHVDNRQTVQEQTTSIPICLLSPRSLSLRQLLLIPERQKTLTINSKIYMTHFQLIIYFKHKEDMMMQLPLEKHIRHYWLLCKWSNFPVQWCNEIYAAIML